MPPRVVSLVPSLTETLLAWGVEPVAVTRFCEQPSLRAVGGTKDPDLAAIVELAPDLVLVNTEENRREDVEALRAAGIAVHVTEVESVAAVGPMLEDLAAALGLAMPDLSAFSSEPWRGERRSSAELEVTAFVPIWRRPWMTLNGSTYGSSLLAGLGVANVYAGAPERYPQVSLEDARSRGPDLVLAPSEPYPFGPRHAPELEQVAPVRLVDGRDLFWWGARTPAAAGRLRRQLLDARPR